MARKCGQFFIVTIIVALTVTTASAAMMEEEYHRELSALGKRSFELYVNDGNVEIISTGSDCIVVSAHRSVFGRSRREVERYLVRNPLHVCEMGDCVVLRHQPPADACCETLSVRLELPDELKLKVRNEHGTVSCDQRNAPYRIVAGREARVTVRDVEVTAKVESPSGTASEPKARHSNFWKRWLDRIAGSIPHLPLDAFGL